MTDLELKKVMVERKRVDAAKEELEFRIAERQADIDRMQDAIKVQVDKLNELDGIVSKELQDRKKG